MRRRYWVIAALVLVLGFVVYAGVRAWQVRGDLTAAQADARELRTALSVGDQPSAEVALTQLKKHSSAAADKTDGPLWATLGVLPVVGDDVDGIKVVSQVLADLSAQGLPPLVDSAADLSAGSFTPKDGKISIRAIESTRKPISRARGSFTAADTSLAEVDSSGFVGPLQSSFDDLSGQIHSASRAMDAAATATDVLPSMLGKQGKRSYLLIFQNNAELRATGGLPSAGAIITADDGKIDMARQITAGDLPYREGEPALPLTDEELQIFGGIVGDYFQDANLTPDFPRTADLMAAHWKREYGQNLDGVLSMDPVAFSYLIKGTGPITVDGVTLTAENAVDELLNKIYIRIQDPEAQNDFFAHVAKAVFDKVTSGAGSPQVILEALSRSATEHRLLVHSFDKAEQGDLSGSVVAGEFLDEADGSRIGVFLNDGTMSKMDYYLDYDVDVRSMSCAASAQTYAGTITMHSDTPEGIATLSPYITGLGDPVVPKGDNYLSMQMYAPAGGAFTRIELDGSELDASYDQHQGRQVASLSLFFKPGERHEVRFRIAGAQGATGATRVDVTPGTAAENESSTVASDCSAQ